MDQKKTAYLGLFAAIAIIFGYVESLIPFFAGIPGMKLGLANLAVLFVLERYTWKEAALVSIVRIFIIGFMFGSGSSIMYSLAGATLSLIVMVFVKNKIGFGQLGLVAFPITSVSCWWRFRQRIRWDCCIIMLRR